MTIPVKVIRHEVDYKASNAVTIMLPPTAERGHPIIASMSMPELLALHDGVSAFIAEHDETATPEDETIVDAEIVSEEE